MNICISKCIYYFSAINPANKVDFDEPEYVLVLQVICKLCFVSFVKNYFEYKKYNFIENGSKFSATNLKTNIQQVAVKTSSEEPEKELTVEQVKSEATSEEAEKELTVEQVKVEETSEEAEKELTVEQVKSAEGTSGTQ